jgi:hypothetical protein
MWDRHDTTDSEEGAVCRSGVLGMWAVSKVYGHFEDFLMLYNLWRDAGSRLGAGAPRLVARAGVTNGVIPELGGLRDHLAWSAGSGMDSLVS